MTWDFDITQAPRGSYVVRNKTLGKGRGDTKDFVADVVILATKCGVVTKSRYLPDEKRWEGLAKGEQPVAWQPWPKHPHAEQVSA
jgi:hypothetical protein